MPVFAKKEGEWLLFDNISACAKYFHLSSVYIRKYLGKNKTWKGYKLSLGDPKKDPRNAKFFRAVVGVAPTGEAVKFDSVPNAAKVFRISNSALLAVLDKRHCSLYCWKFFYTDEYRGNTFVPMTDELLSTFQPRERGEARCESRENEEKPDVEEIDKHEGLTPTKTGYFSAISVVTVCPICGKVVSNNYQKGAKHLRECLAPYEYDIKHNIVRVWSTKN